MPQLALELNPAPVQLQLVWDAPAPAPTPQTAEPQAAAKAAQPQPAWTVEDSQRCRARIEATLADIAAQEAGTLPTYKPRKRTMAERYANTEPEQLATYYRQAEKFLLTDRMLRNRQAKQAEHWAMTKANLKWIAAGSPEPIVWAPKPQDVKRVNNDLERHEWAVKFIRFYDRLPKARRLIRRARRAT